MSDPVTRENLLTAAKQLVDSGIDLVNAIKYPTRNRESKTKTMSTTTKTNVKKYKKMSNVRPSAALVAAKRDAMQKKLLEGQKSMNVSVHDIYQKARDSYDTVRKETGLVFDWSMTEHECLWDLNYPECPDRLRSILQRCKALGLMDRCKEIEPRYAKDEEVLLKHTEEHVKILAATEKCTDNEKLESISSGYDAIFIHPSTYKQSLLAVGCTVDLVQNICKAEVQNGMAIIRPPGHHAMKFEYCGYCFFNNVAIAAQKALNDNLASKILIVDWDVHHGQATQQMFYEDPRVVYFSIHRYEHGKFWPNLRESDYDYVGEGLGKGYNFNVPLNKIGMTNADYIAIFQQVLLPMAYEFQPDLVIVSAGYDAALGCPEGEMLVTPACYTHLLSSLLSLASGKVAVILEGGYCLKSLAESAALTLRTLLGDPCPMLESLESPSESIIQTILNTICAHKPYWKCYQYQDTYSCKSEKIVRNCHIPDVIYSYCNLRSKPSNGYETRNCYPIQSKEQLNAINKELNALIKSTNLSKAQHRLCIVYDDRMLKHYDVSDDTHPEKPNRITGIYNRLKEHGLIERSLLKEGKRATMDQLLSVHSKDYVDRIKSTESQKLKEILKQAAEFNSIYLQPETWASACISAGSLLQVVDSVLTGEAQSGVAIIRPPGHHADKEMACGFCIFNNVAVAAKHALENHHIERLLIVDWDVHHGNGTQAIFEHDPKVLYTSVHRYDNGNFFPNSKQANYTHVGIGLGRGFNVNIPWNNKGMGNAEYIAAFQQVIMPIAYQFNPQLILVSAGFDACVGDPLGGCFVTPEMYGHLTHWLSSLANGRIILCLEGGYNVNSISHAMAMCTKALLGDPLPVLDAGQVPCECAIETIKKVLRTQAEYWPNLAYNKALPAENIFEKSVTNDTQIKNRERNVCKHSESKIALEGIENEKLELKLMIDENCLNVVTVEEVSKLQNEVENMKTSISELTDMVKMIKDIEITDCPREVRREPQLIDEDCQATKTEDYNESACGSITTYQDNNLCFENINTMRYAIIPKRDCPHLHLVADVPPSGIGVNLPCVECNSRDENWICLQCYTVRCGRFIRQHALMHGEEKKHPLTLSLADISVWCYECEAYIQSPLLYPARNTVHLSKFGVEFPSAFKMT
ncbi:hypothetical protein KM043_007623 [Ampulex compressa]|nr:hypothetical protein KM043_007623 [Ampulex compressa]